MSDVTTSEMAESPSPLLTFPDGVENVLISFVSCGDGGLQRILNLRRVCRTTKSWVDNLPKRQADVVFSRTQVAMDCDEQSVSRFLTSPPPFGVTALSLQMPKEALLEEEKERRVDEATWSRFCAFWNIRLETLNAKTTCGRPLPFSRRLVELMESPNLRRLQFCDRLELLRHESLTPSFFQKVRELRMKEIPAADSFRDQFFVQLESNSNLTVLSVSPACKEDIVGCRKVIDRKKHDTKLQLTFDLEPLNFFDLAEDPQTPEKELYREVLGKFAASIVASRSQIRLKLSEMDGFHQLMSDLLSPAVCRQLNAKIEFIDMWTLTEESQFVLERLPFLKILESVEPTGSLVDDDQLAIPPSLEELGFWTGFPGRQRLPHTLTSLTLAYYESDVESLVTSLSILSRLCPELTSLTMRWRYVDGESTQIGSFETPPPQFARLRKLCFKGVIGLKTEVGECRTALVYGFDWRSLQLNFLKLSCADVEMDDYCSCPVMDGEILRNLLWGPSAKTLLTIQVSNKSVTPEGLALLEKARSLASANWKEREGRGGRGGQWRTLYGPSDW